MTRLSILLSAFLAGAVPVLACGGNPVCTVKDPTGTPLNIRLGPNGKIVGNAPNGTELEFVDHVEHESGRWARVARFRPDQDYLTYGEGFIFAAYLDCDERLPEGSLGREIRCTVADPTGTPLNIRMEPNGEIVGSVRNGEVVRVYETVPHNGKLWAKAWRDPTDNAVGWVFDAYLQCEEDGH
jgi:hypothetical protein